MEIDRGITTLIAAVIAALVSIISLLVSTSSKFSSEKREINRKRLEPLIEELGANLYGLMATTVLLIRDKNTVNKGYWLRQIEESRKALRRIRLQVRYSLWGLDEGLRMMISLPDLIYSKKVENKIEILHKATNLRNALDIVIRNCYQLGRSPNYFERKKINFWVTKLKEEWIALKELSEDEELQQIKNKESKIIYPKIYAKITEVKDDSFIAADLNGKLYSINKNNKRGKGSSNDIVIGKEIKLFKRDGEEFFRFRFKGG